MKIKKRIKRIVSIIIVLLIAMNCVPLTSAAQEVLLTINGDINDAVTDVEYGWDGSKYCFGDDVLIGVEEGDEVHLVADVSINNPTEGADSLEDLLTVGSTVSIDLFNFRLEGTGAFKYSLPENLESLSINKLIKINKKIIRIAPAHSYIYFGQDKPEQITELADYSEQIVNNEDVEISAVFEIEYGDNTGIGEYNVNMISSNINGEDADNYNVVLDSEAKFSIRAYEPEGVEDFSVGKYEGVEQAELNAPEHFLISNDNNPDGEWSESITIKLNETQDKDSKEEYTYYLRNNNANDNNYYKAISETKTYKYTSLKTKPVVTGVKLEKVDTDTILNFLTFGVFGNGKTKATVFVDGAALPQDTTIYLGEQKDNAESIIVKAEKAEFNEDKNKYTYTAVFEFDADAGESVTKNLKAWAENTCGESGKYELGSLTIDKKAPHIDGEIEIEGNYDSDGNGIKDAIKASFTVVDSGSGIAKVEYKWDSEIKEDDKEVQVAFSNENSENSENSENNGRITEKDISIVTSWDCLDKTVSESKHTLYLRLTDKLGNTSTINKKDDESIDIDDPKIESVEIRKANNESDGDIRFTANGAFYKKTVEIAIKANDNENKPGHYATGVSSVKVEYNYNTYDKSNETAKAEKNKNGEYVVTVEPNKIMKGMQIVVSDVSGRKQVAYVTKVSELGVIKSNDLIVENVPPTISFGKSFEKILNDEGHQDNNGNVWFGSGDINTEMQIIVADDQGDVKSGLYSVTVTDNGEEKYSERYDPIKTEKDEKTIKISELSDGKHEFKVVAQDYCGNTVNESITFYKDTESPNGRIEVGTTESSKDIDGCLWFDGEDIIKFRVNSSDSVESSEDVSGISKIELKITGEKENIFTFEHCDISQDEKGSYVEVDTSGIKPDKEHKYTVSGTVTDFANNEKLLDKVIVYKDFDNPVIAKVTVQKASENVIDKILKVLSFGVFSNDKLIIKAYTKENSEHDSGIDYATFQYNGMTEAENMDYEGVDENGCSVFSFEIPVSETEVFESNIDITVYDKFGKKSEVCPNLSSATDREAVSDGKLVMVETVPPVLTIDMPAGDSVPRDDEQVWYNSNNEIKLITQDIHSGINNIALTVNGNEVKKDKNKATLLHNSDSGNDSDDDYDNINSEKAESRNNNELKYLFDTDYFMSVCGSEDGEYKINVEVTDNAGNVKNVERTYYLDTVAPIINRIDFIPQTSQGIANTKDFIEELEYGYYFKTDFNVTVNVSDADQSSGLFELKYRFVPYQDGKKQEETSGSLKITDGKATLSVPKGFKGQIFVEAFDCVLNSSGEKTAKAYVVDKAAPDIKITKNVNTNYRDAAGNNLYTETNSFTVVITDTVSGIKEIGYLQSAEQNPFDRKTIDIDNAGYNLKDDLGDGWIVTGTDVNLVTQVTKVFSFPSDDNDVVLTFDAMDNSHNKADPMQSEKFTVDKTAPIINVVFRDDDDKDVYYNQNRVADITVIDRNFDADLIKIQIVNTFGDVPAYSFTEKSKTEHTAVIDFDEGDYTFDLTGTDLGNHTATVNFSGGNENLFYVDKTKPVVEENFAEFSNSAENSFKVDKTASIKITEHNFDPELVNLRVLRKAAGEEHNADGLEDATSEVVGIAKWNSAGDVHTISFTFDRDAVYYVEIAPADLASNNADKRNTVIFEIDKTVPIVSMKNGSYVSKDDTEFLDVYPYERKDAETPTVEFQDLNISYIKYDLSLYIPERIASDEVVVKAKNMKGTVEGNKYTLPDFKEDGVYAVQLTAVDVAGNESELNLNTYARMINQDVLAYILNSSIEKKTGLYSIQYENGDAISKKPSSFDDFSIFVMAKKETPIDIVLRDTNGQEITTNAQYTTDDSVYGIGVYNYQLKADFFKENFQDDTDIEMHLTVKNQGDRIDLGKMHIDNIAPECDMSEDLASWHWFYGEDDRTFTLSNISELVDESSCRIYDNGKALPFTYSNSDNTITFTLTKGWHNVGIVLDDMAGNANNIQEKTNIHIGYFWLWVIIILFASTALGSACIAIFTQRRKKREAEVEQ